jgi:hypothetical protein
MTVSEHHITSGGPLEEGVALVATNVVLFGGIFLSYRVLDWGFAGFLVALFLFSSMYHMCRADFACITTLTKHQWLDHIAVHAVILWIAACIAVKRSMFQKEAVQNIPGIVVETRIFFFAIASMFAYMAIINDPEAHSTTIISFVVPLAFVVIACAVARKRIFYSNLLGWSGIALFGASLVFYKLCTHRDYGWAHSVWHILSMPAAIMIRFASDCNLLKRSKEVLKCK